MALTRVCACFRSTLELRRAFADHARLSRGSSARLTALFTQIWVAPGIQTPGASPNNRERPRLHLDHLPNNGRVGSEAALPQAMADDRDG